NKQPDKITLVKLSNPAEPEPVKASYHTYQLAVKVPDTPVPAPTSQKGGVEPVKASTLPETGDGDNMVMVAVGGSLLALALGAGAYTFKLKVGDSK
ncbi:LPXTG cell wall anchor domain-containing protein, partial [Streptococcus sobrinus]